MHKWPADIERLKKNQVTMATYRLGISKVAFYYFYL